MNTNHFINNAIRYCEELNTDSISGYGLYSGKAKLIALYYALHACTGKDVFASKAKTLLDEVGSNISRVGTVYFNDGLAGIGWTIEWLSQNKYLHINTDEILEDLDTRIYRTVMYEPGKTLRLDNGILGLSLYLLSRYRSKNYLTPRLKTISHQECLVVLTDEMETKLAAWQHESDAAAIQNLSQVMMHTGKIWRYKLNLETTERIMYLSVDIVDRVCNENLHTEPALTGSLMQLAYAKYGAGCIFNIDSWVEESRQYISMLSSLTPAGYVDLSLVCSMYEDSLVDRGYFDQALTSHSDLFKSPLHCLGVLSASAENRELSMENWGEYYLG